MSARRARIETRFADEHDAGRIARALEPDNTAEMETRADGAAVITEVRRPNTGGLQATVDDYVVNLQVAAELTAQDGETSTPEDRGPSTVDQSTGDGEQSTPEDRGPSHEDGEQSTT